MNPTLVLVLLFLSGLAVGQTPTPVPILPNQISKWVLSKKFENVPPHVRSFHAKGTINVLVHVNTKGTLEKVTMLSGFKHIDFMREYIEREVSSWRFKPLRKNRRYVDYRGIVTIPFYYGTFPRKMP